MKSKIAIITGSAGLIGSEAVCFLQNKFDLIIGVDNNMRSYFFGKEASVEWNIIRLQNSVPNYKHFNVDIRNYEMLEEIFQRYSDDIDLIIHTAAQPSHDWAAKEPITDFEINATGTLNILELTRLFCSNAVFIYTSTNKVYGANPNNLPLLEQENRWEIDENHTFFKNGIDESLSIDNTKHSVFGASKLSADIMCQEYGKYFGLKTGIFRGGCLTGPNHSGSKLHGFLSYLMKCSITKTRYTVLGYKGKQVRDNIHSWDLVNMFWHFYLNPKKGEVYNVGGGRHSNCSMKEAILKCNEITGNKMDWVYNSNNRIGDHIWWISDVSKFRTHYQDWDWKYNLDDILFQIFKNFKKRL